MHAIGWKRVTAAQRAVLDELADRHGGPEWAAGLIRGLAERPPAVDVDPLELVIVEDRALQARRRRSANREEAEAEERRNGQRDPVAPLQPRVADDGLSEEEIEARAARLEEMFASGPPEGEA